MRPMETWGGKHSPPYFIKSQVFLSLPAWSPRALELVTLLLAPVDNGFGNRFWGSIGRRQRGTEGAGAVYGWCRSQPSPLLWDELRQGRPWLLMGWGKVGAILSFTAIWVRSALSLAGHGSMGKDCPLWG